MRGSILDVKEIQAMGKPAGLADRATISVVLVGEGGYPLWGMTPEARLARALKRLKKGAERQDAPRPGAATLFLRRDWYVEIRALNSLLDHPGVIVTAKAAAGEMIIAAHASADQAEAVRQLVAHGDLTGITVPDGFRIVAINDICDAYNKELRKAEPPLLSYMGEKSALAIEWEMYRAAYKGVTDIVTKYVWPIPAFWVTKAAARLHLTPNMVTSVGFVLVLAAQWLFWRGDFWLGLLAAYVMVFLDTVDGKLARVTLTSSKWGNLFDHGIDLIHPPFWWLAWWMGLYATGYGDAPGMAVWLDWSLGIIWIGYMVGRAIEGVFMHTFGFHVHIWRKLDSVMREITSRRNPNMVILTVAMLFGRPDIGFLAIAIWTLICVPFHMVRVAEALFLARKGVPIRSWLSE